MTFRPSGLLGMLLAICLGSGRAHATASSCAGLGDGTACATSCIVSGTCKTNVCIPTQLRPNGSTCVSENRCTTDDVCSDGICTNGRPVVCPGQGCLIGTCLPQFGCLLLNACKPDFGVSVGDMSAPVDMSAEVDQGPVKPDLGFYVDLAGTDLAPPTGDMCYQPPGAEFQICPGGDGPVVRPIDGGTGDAAIDASIELDGAALGDGGSLGGHLRGSRPGDCSLTPGARPRGTLGFAALLALLVVSLRRRAT